MACYGGRIAGMKFTIRDLIWLMVAVALGCGWWIEHSSLTRTRAHAQELRVNLSRAWWWYGPGIKTGSNQEVDWEVIQKPIP